MPDSKDGVVVDHGKEVTLQDQEKEVHAAYSDSHAYSGKEVSSAAPAYAGNGLYPGFQDDSPIPVEYEHEKARGAASAPAICGLSRRIFLITLGVAVAAVLALALGLGLGLGLRSHSSNTTLAASTTSATAASGVATTTSTSSSAASTSNATLPEASTTCPSSNGTTYSSSNRTFLILCESDIQAPNRADLGRNYKPSFTECIDLCASIGNSKQQTDVSAVYWDNPAQYDAAALGTCWCIGGTSRAENATTYYIANNDLAWIQS